MNTLKFRTGIYDIAMSEVENRGTFCFGHGIGYASAIERTQWMLFL